MSKKTGQNEKAFAQGAESTVYKRGDQLVFVPSEQELKANAGNPIWLIESATKLQDIISKLDENPAIRITEHTILTGTQAIKEIGKELYTESFASVLTQTRQKLTETDLNEDEIAQYATCTKQSMLPEEYQQMQTKQDNTETICAMTKPNITACDALDQLTHIHAAGVTHADIGAHNLFVKQEGKDVGTVHFIDFGDGKAALERDKRFDTGKKEDCHALAWTILESVYQVKNNATTKSYEAKNATGETIYRTKTRNRDSVDHEEFKEFVEKAELMQPSDNQEIAATKAFIIAVHAGKHPYEIYQDMKKNHGTSKMLKTIEDISTVKEKKTAHLIKDYKGKNLGSIEILSNLSRNNPTLCRTESFKNFRESVAEQSIEELHSQSLDEFSILSHIAEKEPELRKTKTVQNMINRCKTINVLLVVVSILLPPLAPAMAILIVDNAQRIKQAENAQSETVEKAKSTLKQGNSDLETPLLSGKSSTESSTQSRPAAFNQGKTAATIDADKENQAQGQNKNNPDLDEDSIPRQ